MLLGENGQVIPAVFVGVLEGIADFVEEQTEDQDGVKHQGHRQVCDIIVPEQSLLVEEPFKHVAPPV
jgi:hypothetical protein